MKTIIAGSRKEWIPETEENFFALQKAIELSGIQITEVICGMCDGVDMIGNVWAEMNNIPVIEMPANWKKYRRAAGPIRNGEMARISEAAIVIVPNKIHLQEVSKGSKNMINQHLKLGKLTKVYFLDELLELINKEKEI